MGRASMARTSHVVEALVAEALGDVGTLGRKDQGFVRTRHPSRSVPLSLVSRERAEAMAQGTPVLFREVTPEGGAPWTVEEPLEEAEGRPLGLAALGAFGLEAAWVAAEAAGVPVEVTALPTIAEDEVRRRLVAEGGVADDATVATLRAFARMLTRASPRTRLWIGGLDPLDDQAASDEEVEAFEAIEAPRCSEADFDAYFALLARGGRRDVR